MTKRVPVLYVDIDGTVREGKDDALGRFVNRPEDVRVFPKAVSLMQMWKAEGGRIVGVTNQGGVALGLVNFFDMKAALRETHKQSDGAFDKIMICIHHPDSKNPELARCWCRKPKAGLVVEGALELALAYDEIYPPHIALFVGDRPEDRGCAEAADIDFMDAKDWRAS